MRTRNTGKEQLVKQKAIELLVKDGFEGFSMNKLARACNISVATLYIYYKDKKDLIIRIALEEADMMTQSVLKDFNPDMNFEEGLRLQWKNRSDYMLKNPMTNALFEQLRFSTFSDRVFKKVKSNFGNAMGKFMKNAVARGEINPMPMEVYWSVAYAPLYNLIRFHQEGKNMAGKSFVLTQKLIWQTFELTLKGIKK
jgi:AcrR family transcriptional regulator